MPLRLSDLTSETRTERIEFDGHAVTVSFRLNVLTSGYEKRTETMTDSESTDYMLAEIITKHDIVDDKDQPIPLADVLSQLDIRVKNGLLSAIIKASSPNFYQGAT